MTQGDRAWPKGLAAEPHLREWMSSGAGVVLNLLH